MGLNRIKAAFRGTAGVLALLRVVAPLGEFFSVLTAFAQGPNDWTDSRYYVECGQDCLYQKGNENVTAQSLYLVKKMENLKQILDGGTQNPTNYEKLATELQLYCPEVTPSSAKVDEANICYKRYVQTQIPILRALKATIVKNEDMTSRLKTEQGSIGAGEVKSSSFEDETPGARKAQTPEFKREDELLTTKAGQDRLKYLAGATYQAWAAQVSSLRPKPEDFPVTEQVLKDPNDPTSMKVSRIKRDSLGVPILDKNAFARADAEYRQSILGTTKKSTPLSLTEIAKTKGMAKVRDIDPNADKGWITQKGAPPKANDSQLDKTSYNQARNLALQSELNLFARGVSEKSYPGAPRKPASANNKSPQGPPGTQAKNTDDSTAKAQATSYDQIVAPVPEATTRPVPMGGTNTVYSVTLSPDELEKRINAFEQDAINLK